MLKKTKKAYFRYRGRIMNTKTLYANLCRTKWSTKKKYLYSPIVSFDVDRQEALTKLVFVSKRGDKDDCLVLGTTKTSLRPQEIIKMYSRGWQIRLL